MYACMHVYMCVNLCLCIYVCMYMFITSVFVRLYVSLCMYICVFKCLYLGIVFSNEHVFCFDHMISSTYRKRKRKFEKKYITLLFRKDIGKLQS